jgi:enoyl-CoA hydratase/carnithine racemase
LNRPDKANTQNLQILYDLNNAFDKACQDNEVKVVLLRAEEKHFIFFRLLRSFTSGHDLANKSEVIGKTWPIASTHANFNPVHACSKADLKAHKSKMVDFLFCSSQKGRRDVQ